MSGPSGNNFYFTVLTSDSSATVQADTFELTPDGSCIIFQTISVNNNPSQGPIYASQALYKAAAVTSINILQQVATPAFSPPGGYYSSSQTVTISDATAGATIYYTTNGSTPTTGSSVYSTPITVTLPTTLQAIGVLGGFGQSAVASANYLPT